MSNILLIPASAFLLYLFDRKTRQNVNVPALTKKDTLPGYNRVPEIGKGCGCDNTVVSKSDLDKIGSNNFLSCGCRKQPYDLSYKCNDASKESCALHKRKMASTNPYLGQAGVSYNSHLKLINSGRKCQSVVGIVPDPINSNNHFTPSQFSDF